MNTSTKLPENLWSIRDAVVDLVHADKNPPPEISQIYEWLENDGWDELCGEGSNEEMVIELRRFCEDEDELREFFDVDGSVEITDQMRVDFSRDLLEKVNSGKIDYDYPTVTSYLLKGVDGRSVVICGALNIQYGGWDIEWDGVFLTTSQFLECLKSSGFYLTQDIASIEDASIISCWKQ